MKNGTKNLGVCSMKIGLNPAVSSVNGMGLNRGVKKSNLNQPTFEAVNKRYLEWAEKNYKIAKNGATATWLMSLEDDVILFKDILKQDAIDTMNAARKYVNKGSMEAFETTLAAIKRS